MFSKFVSNTLIIFILYQVRGQNVSQVFDSNENVTEQLPALHLIHRGVKSYYIGDIFKGNFFRADQFCKYHGMSLVNIESQEENNFLQQEIIRRGDSGQHFWLSGTKLPDSRRWISFTTARALTHFNWGTGEPNNAKKNEYCIEMRFVDNNLKWNDVNCWEDFDFICEITWSQECKKVYELLKNTNKPRQTNISFIGDSSKMVTGK